MSLQNTALAPIDREYEITIVRFFTVMAVVWGIVGMSIGVFIASQLAWPALNFDIPWLTFSRLRPLHTNAVIFAFGGSALFATSYYIVQRTCKTRLFAPYLAWFTFWGWQTVIVAAVITLPLGLTSTKEYAELEWPIDILIALVWISYAIVFFGTLIKRKTSHIYVANWFFAAFIITIALLHIVNSMAIPVSAFKSYSLFGGATDAMVQWWYGHNAVGFYLTAAFLGMMYYFVPVQIGRPIYSYRLSIVHFWALIASYMWAGGHHLHYSALPDWTQSLAMVFSIILFAPSWGGMITIGSLYVLLPRIYNKPKMYSISLITTHFWLATAGTIFYIVSMWISGIGQGMMWLATNPDGTLVYSFVDTVEFSHFPYIGRAFGGLLYVSGMFVMAYNVYRTIKMPEGKPVDIADPTDHEPSVDQISTAKV